MNRTIVKPNVAAMWKADDTLAVDGVRWRITAVHGQDVHLEATSTSGRVRWNTTLANLPAKPATP